MNNCFAEYKNIHKDMPGVLMGTGPTFKEYVKEEHQGNISEELFKLGCNAAMYADIPLHYYFLGDPGKEHHEMVFDLSTLRTVKWLRGKNYICCGVQKGFTGNYYSTLHRIHTPEDFSEDIVKSMAVSGTIMMEVLQYAVYTGMCPLYIVGCDIVPGKQSEEYLAAGKTPRQAEVQIKGHTELWRKAAEWLRKVNTETYVINPVGLKEIFPEKPMGVLYAD